MIKSVVIIYLIKLNRLNVEIATVVGSAKPAATVREPKRGHI